MEEQTKSGSNNVKLAIVVVVLILVAAAAAFGYMTMNKTAPTSTSETNQETQQETSQEESTTEQTAAYQDGTYTATGNYISPGGPEEMGVTVTLENGVITSSEVEPRATRPNSVRFQGMFASGYKELVEGKNIDEVELSKVSGASLAPQGFNEALEEIKTQARS